MVKDWISAQSVSFSKYLSKFNPWTPVYSLARSVIALSLLLTLIFNKITTLFPYPIALSNETSSPFSIFHILGFNSVGLVMGKTVCILILLAVISGYFPQITGLLHYWVAFSVQNSMTTIDGGEQVAVVITLLLIPIAVTDFRKNAWLQVSPNKNDLRDYFKIIGLMFYWALRFQVFVIYADAFIQKLSVKEWLDGTSLYYYFNNYLISMPNIFHKMFDFILNSKLVIIPTWGTLIAECLLMLSFLAPVGKWKYFFLLGFFMHLMFAIIIGLFSFSLVMIGALVLYLVPLKTDLYELRTHSNSLKLSTIKSSPHSKEEN